MCTVVCHICLCFTQGRPIEFQGQHDPVFLSALRAIFPRYDDIFPDPRRPTATSRSPDVFPSEEKWGQTRNETGGKTRSSWTSPLHVPCRQQGEIREVILHERHVTITKMASETGAPYS